MAFKVSKVDSASAPGFRRDSHHARLLRESGDEDDMLVPPCRRAGAHTRPPATRVLGSAAASRGGTTDDVSGRAFGFMA